MKRAYYSNTIEGFILESNMSIMGNLTTNHSNRSLEELQKNAWLKQIDILKDQLKGFKGKIYFEFTIPRMGKRVDNIVIVNNIAFIIEFKVGEGGYDKQAINQVIDYTRDLQNFHEGSHDIMLIPVLVATNADNIEEQTSKVISHRTAAKSNQFNLAVTLNKYLENIGESIDVQYWENSIYKPTPTIVEAAKALYNNHNIEEITRSDSGKINLTKTTRCINSIIEKSKSNNIKSICFVTGVPGAGKTLAGLDISVKRMNTDKKENAVFLSGNGPLVDVLREALTRDHVMSAKENGENITKGSAAIKSNAFIQNIHHFRDDNIRSNHPPTEKVVVFDEAQRAWTNEAVSSFMKRKKGIDDFNKSEPEFLIDVMNRHEEWCTIVCLIGGGQEINKGEAGIEEWIESLRNHFSNWNIYYSNSILVSDNYLKSEDSKQWLIDNGTSEIELHLSVSVRSFRSEKLSYFVHELLNIKVENSKKIYGELQNLYPIVLTRNLDQAKTWLREKAIGTERIGLISSSGAKRLKPFGIDVKNEISVPYWFLNDAEDVRSSYFLELATTEFDIQGLEIDWACIAWGGNFYRSGNDWRYQKFTGSKWQNINKSINKDYLKNAYRVLLTRARQGMVIFIPKGDELDSTRPHKYYDETYEYFREIGIKTI